MLVPITARVERPTDAVLRITHACVCGSDLWFYRGIQDYKEGWRCGHEWMGVVEDVGSEVEGFRPGDRVVAPFVFSDGDCEFCRKGLQTSCVNGAPWATTNDGGQGEAVRAPFADGTLVKLPEEVEGDEGLLKAILPLTDVMGTGHTPRSPRACARAGRPRWSATGRWGCARSWPPRGSGRSASSCSATTRTG
jgi:threonine dehydrogenase-like Zn-dependent dehydrogenase